MRKLVFILTIACCAIFYQCQDATNLDLQNQSDLGNDATVQLRSELNHPSLVNGVLKFTDTTHFFTYYEELESILIESDSLFELSVFQSDDFTSVYQKLLNDSFVNPIDMYQPFLTDPVMRAITNEYFEFQVDDRLYTYYNNEVVIVSDPTNSTSQSQLRALPKGGDIDTNTLPANTFWASDSKKSTFSDIFSWCSCDINIQLTDCNNAKVWGICKGLLWGYGKGDVEICVTTSSTPPWNTVVCNKHKTNGPFEFNIDLSSYGGIMYIHAQANSNCAYDDYEFMEIDMDYIYCDFEERSTSERVTDGYNQGLLIQTAYYKNVVGTPKFKAESWPEHWNGSRWKRHRADLEVTIDATSGHNTCVNGDREAKTKNCNNCKHETAIVNPHNLRLFPTPAHCDGDVFGSFEKTKGSSNFTANNTIDFECCQ